MGLHRTGKDTQTNSFRASFIATCELIERDFPDKPFHVRGPLNLAALDSVMATLIKFSKKTPKDIGERFKKLLKDKKYQEVIFYNTSDNVSVESRLRIAKEFLID